MRWSRSHVDVVLNGFDEVQRSIVLQSCTYHRKLKDDPARTSHNPWNEQGQKSKTGRGWDSRGHDVHGFCMHRWLEAIAARSKKSTMRTTTDLIWQNFCKYDRHTPGRSSIWQCLLAGPLVTGHPENMTCICEVSMHLHAQHTAHRGSCPLKAVSYTHLTLPTKRIV